MPETQQTGGSEANPFINTSGGFNTGALGGFFNALAQMLFPNLQQSLQGSQPLSSLFSNYLQSNFPHEMFNQMRGTLNEQTGQSSRLGQQSFNQLLPFLGQMGGNLNYLNQYGLPGTQQMLGSMGQLGGMGMGQLGTLNPILQQIMTQGLPGQSSISGMVNPLSQFGMGQLGGAGEMTSRLGQGEQLLSPFQQQLQSTLGSFVQGGGLTPEFVKAQRQLVLEPARESLMGNLNQLAGGEVALTSPAFQDVLRRQETDFGNQLISQGFNNLQGFMNQAQQSGATGFGQGMGLAGLQGQLGGQGVGQAMGAFGAVPSAAYPFFNLAGQQGLGQLGQALNQYGTAGSLGLNNLSTIQQLMMQPYQMAQQGAYGGVDRQSQALQQFLSSVMAGSGQQQQYALGSAGNLVDMLRAMSSIYGAEQEQSSRSSIAKALGTGQGIAGIASQIPAIIKAIRGSGTSTTTTGGGGSGGGGEGQSSVWKRIIDILLGGGSDLGSGGGTRFAGTWPGYNSGANWNLGTFGTPYRNPGSDFNYMDFLRYM